MCVADTPSPSHTRGNGRPKSPPEPAEHGPESLSSCSKWDQPCEAFPVYAGKFISTTLLFWWWQIQRRHSSVLPLILQGRQPPHSWRWTMALLYYPLGCSGQGTSPAALILVHPRAHGSASSLHELKLPSKEGHPLWQQPPRTPFQLRRISKTIASEKWNKKGTGTQGGSLTDQPLFFSRSFTSQPYTSMATTFSRHLFPIPVLFRSVFGAKRAGGQCDSWNEQC